MALLASPLGAQDLAAQLDFEFQLGFGRRWLRGPRFLFLMVFFLVFLLVLLVLLLVYSVAVGTRQTQLQCFPCGGKACQRCTAGAEQWRALKNGIRLKGPPLPRVRVVTIATAPPFFSHLWLNTLEALKSKKGAPFLQTPNLLYRPSLTWLRGLHSPRSAPAPPQLTHGFLLGKVAGNGRAQADMPFPPCGRSNSSEITRHFRSIATMFVRGTH